MSEFIFPQGAIWILAEPQELAVADLGDGKLALLLFTDEDLADTYKVKARLHSKMPVAINGWSALLPMLARLRGSGVTHVITDHAPGGSGGHASKIEKVMEDGSKTPG